MSSSRNIHVHAICCVDGGTGGHPRVMTWRDRECELAQDDSQSYDSLHECKLVSHALAGAPTEWDVPAQAFVRSIRTGEYDKQVRRTSTWTYW